MLGYSEPELGDARGEWLGRVHPDDRAALTQALEAHLSGASHHFEHEHRIQHRDGSYRWVLARGMAVRDAQGRATARRRQPDRRDGPQAGRAAPAARRPARRADRPAQPRAVPRPPRPGDPPRPARAPERRGRRPVPRPRPLQARQRLARPPGRRPAADRGRAPARVGRPAAGHRRPPRRRRVHRPARRRVRRARGDRWSPSASTQTLRTPFEIDERELFIDASIGIALADPGAAPDTVLRDADVAMYRAKADGKGRHAVFDAQHARAGHAPARHGDRAAAGDRGAAARGRLPADRAGGDRPHRRLRGAHALARAAAASSSRRSSSRSPRRPA